ncbi:MAG: type II secretion system F family protein [Planctomycetota bacterium]|jgi:type II secretory pathway component PulF
MLNYNFKAKSNEGTLVYGSMRADRRESVIDAMKQKGYYLLSVEPEGRLTRLLRSDAGLRSRVSLRDKAIFTHQLGTLLRAGMQLSVALKTLSKQTQNKYLASVVQQIERDIEQSSSLSQAMAKHPRVFSQVYTAIVEAAEQSGSLAETLLVLSKQLKERAAVSARIRGAMVYPIFLLFVSAVVIGVLTAFVIPKFIELFVNVQQALPLPTRILIGTTSLVKQFWWLGTLAVCAVACLSLVALRDARVRLSLDGLLLKLPVAGALNRKIQLARFSRTLGSLLNGGVRIVSAVRTTRGITTNRAFAREIANVEEAILKGSTLARVIKEQDYFSEIAANMIAVGEDTGMLPEMLLEVADMYDQECESAISSMTNLLGPVMIIVLGLIIGFVVMAILLPIFETSAMVG